MDKVFLSKLNKSKDAVRLIENFSYLVVLQIGGYVLPILTYPYLARVIGVEGFGKIAFAMSLIVYFMTIIDWGYNFTATREVARNRDNLNALSEIYSVVTSSKILLLVISLVVLCCGIITIPLLNDYLDVILFSFTMLIGYSIFPEWLFQGLENMRFIVILNLLSKVFFTILIFIFVKTPEDYVFQPLFSGLGYVLAGVISLIYIKNKLNIKFHFCSFNRIFSSIKDSFDVFINNLMPNLYNSFSVILLGYFGGSCANGLLDAANKFYTICAQFLTVLSRAFFPFLSRRIDKHNVFVKIKLCLTFFFAIILVLTAKPLIEIVLGESFIEAVPLLQILGVSLIFHSITNIYGTNFLIIIGKEKLLRNITAIVSIIGFIVSFPLIYFYSYLGAACTVAITRILLGVVVLYVAKSIAKTSNNIN